MNIELLKLIVPPILTGICGFMIAKINRNVPIDKLEITYNRVYYPLYKLIKEFDEAGEIDHIRLQKLYKKLKLKYDKYISPGTKYLFKRYIQSLEIKVNSKKDFLKLHDNIVRINGYIRYKLGYLTTSYFDAFKIISGVQKGIFFSVFLLSFTYALIILSTAIINKNLIAIRDIFASLTVLALIMTAVLFIYDLVKAWIAKK